MHPFSQLFGRCDFLRKKIQSFLHEKFKFDWFQRGRDQPYPYKLQAIQVDGSACNGDNDRIFHYKWSFTCTVKTFLLLLRTSIRDSKSRCQGDSTRHWEQWFSIARKFSKKNINEMLIKIFEIHHNRPEKIKNLVSSIKKKKGFYSWIIFTRKSIFRHRWNKQGIESNLTIINRLVFIIRV